MKRPIYDIETDGDVTVVMQVTTPYIETEYGKQLLADEICIVMIMMNQSKLLFY